MVSSKGRLRFRVSDLEDVGEIAFSLLSRRSYYFLRLERLLLLNTGNETCRKEETEKEFEI